ncbi:MAG: glycosyltransferase [Actinobacteria bacterium]|nr:glycosyltransferase [Actinomycetota bacterium]
MTRELIFTATFNERENVEAWVRGVAGARPDADMLIIDDSSPDGTAAIIRELQSEFPQLTVVERSGKQGLNTAHLLAMNHALDQGYDLLVTMDADGSHQPRQIPGLIGAVDPAEFVIGTRTHGGTHQATLPRQLLSKGANRTARILLPMGLTEYTTSFRVFTPKALRAITEADLRFSGYSFFIECLETLHRNGIVMAERPIDFLDRAGGTSKIPRNQIFLSMETLIRLAVERRRPTATPSEVDPGRTR